MSSKSTRRMKIGDFLLRRLEEAGIRHLFGVPGDYNLELLQQLHDTGALKWMVPTLTCGLVREKTSLAIVPPQVQSKWPQMSSGIR